MWRFARKAQCARLFSMEMAITGSSDAIMGDLVETGVVGSVAEVDLKELITQCGAVLRGHFKLASGRHSDIYVEKFRILERPKVLALVSKSLADHFAPKRPDIIVGPSTGGILVAYEVARQLDTTAVYVETEDGKRSLRRNGRIEPGARVLLVDDVLTTGISLTEVLAVIEAADAELVGIGVLIDRSEKAIDFGCDFHAATRFEATTYAEGDLPDWLARIPLHTPGTRAKGVPG
ncbi:MAG: orotate phosphoribosyltransferase [Fimbriimonadaceae bacterium]